MYFVKINWGEEISHLVYETTNKKKKCWSCKLHAIVAWPNSHMERGENKTSEIPWPGLQPVYATPKQVFGLAMKLADRKRDLDEKYVIGIFRLILGGSRT